MFASVDDVIAKRQAAHAVALDKAATAAGEVLSEPLPPPLPREDGELLCAHYERKLQEVCQDENARDPSRFTNRVLCTAQLYYKRFYLHVSPMEEDPKGVMLAALYLAGKVEEERIQVHDLVPKYAKQLQPEALLALELRLMEALRFQLVVRSPFRCLTGLLQDLHASVGPDSARPSVIHELQEMHQRSNELVCRMLRADAPFLYTPQQIALAALLPAPSQLDAAPHPSGEVDVRAWIERRFGDACGHESRSECDDVAPLMEQLARLQQEGCRYDLNAEGIAARLKAIDAQLRRLVKHTQRVDKVWQERHALKRQRKDLPKASGHESELSAPTVKVENSGPALGNGEGAGSKRPRAQEASVEDVVKREC